MKKNKKDCLLVTLQLAVFGILALLLLVLTVTELIPDSSQGLEVRQPIKVSSSSLSPIGAEIKDYHSQVAGSLFNPTDETVTVDSVNVTVSDGKNEKVVTVEGFTLPARTEREITASFEGQISFDRVTEVSVVRGAETDLLPNQTASAFDVSGIVIFYAVLLVIAVLLTVRAAKVRYYLYQETKNR